MSQSCLNCLKYTMCVVNFICWLFGATTLGLGVYLMMNSKFSSLIPTLASLNIANTLIIIGTIVTCISFLGFLGALKENRCLLVSFFVLLFILMVAELGMACAMLMFESEIDTFFKKDLMNSLKESKESRKHGNSTIKDDWDRVQITFQCCGVTNVSDWNSSVPTSCCVTETCTPPKYWPEGCYNKVKTWFEENLLSTGLGVIGLCVIEVLGMCFAMTLFCHISRSGLGYK
ncbi:leukocyte surface antigen CD53-like [Megalops cyprinoides]|uniref:leukocyte surface antigen CD53-like n=1 Tax=Megalops cyprinoides TaxID=118141 RepID=UPI0018653D85|nr:leukocyte surface antigen CD53-like [Megalops cyprinoides]